MTNQVCSGEGAQAALEAARSSQMSEQGSVQNSELRPGWFPGKGSLSSQEVEPKPGLGQQESRNPGQQEFDNVVSRRGYTHRTSGEKKPEHVSPLCAMRRHKPGREELTLSTAGSHVGTPEFSVRAEYVSRPQGRGHACLHKGPELGRVQA